jgi:hypothetical protein
LVGPPNRTTEDVRYRLRWLLDTLRSESEPRWRRSPRRVGIWPEPAQVGDAARLDELIAGLPTDRGRTDFTRALDMLEDRAPGLACIAGRSRSPPSPATATRSSAMALAKRVRTYHSSPQACTTDKTRS